jgi:hypothetical protein
MPLLARRRKRNERVTEYLVTVCCSKKKLLYRSEKTVAKSHRTFFWRATAFVFSDYPTEQKQLKSYLFRASCRHRYSRARLRARYRGTEYSGNNGGPRALRNTVLRYSGTTEYVPESVLLCRRPTFREYTWNQNKLQWPVLTAITADCR